jgi:hypothetical protein
MPDAIATPYLSPSNPTFSAFMGDLVTVSTDVPLPPGARVEFDLSLVGQNKIVHLLGKVAKVTPVKSGGFQLFVRLHTLSREERSALTAENQS